MAQIAALKSQAKLGVINASTKVAATIYEYAVISANSTWAAYDLARLNRGKPRGITTDQEQDLLRAMLVFAASGLDATLKRLVVDALPILVVSNDTVHDAFEKFCQKRLQSGDAEIIGVAPKILARILAASNPQQQLIQDYVTELTGDSLQSVDQLFRVCAALGANQKSTVGDAKELKQVFVARNEIVHEFDMNLAHPTRKRTVRKQDDMQTYTERLLGVSAAIITDVDKRISV